MMMTTILQCRLDLLREWLSPMLSDAQKSVRPEYRRQRLHRCYTPGQDLLVRGKRAGLYTGPEGGTGVASPGLDYLARPLTKVIHGEGSPSIGTTLTKG